MLASSALRLLASLFFSIFYVIGWVAAKTWGAWAAIVTAVLLGWSDARRTDGKHGAV